MRLCWNSTYHVQNSEKVCVHMWKMHRCAIVKDIAAQRMQKYVLCECGERGVVQRYAAAYLDDIIIYSNDWQRHMEHLRAVLRALRVAGLTANPKKWAVGRVEVRYLDFHLGHGQVRPQINKTAAAETCPRPKTKKVVRQFLGMVRYYGRFVPNYSYLTSPLTDLTKKEALDPVQWMELSQQAFTQVNVLLTFLSPSCCRPMHRTGGCSPVPGDRGRRTAGAVH